MRTSFLQPYINKHIHQLINAKGIEEDMQRDNFSLEDGFVVYRRLTKASDIDFLPIYVGLHELGKILYYTQLQSGSHYCSDCSYDTGRSVYHIDNTPFTELTIVFKKHTSILQAIENAPRSAR
jgi:hypothetical protein